MSTSETFAPMLSIFLELLLFLLELLPCPFHLLVSPLEMLPSFASNTTCKSPRGPPPPYSSCCTVILKCPLFLGPSVYELNSIKNACKCLLPSKSKPNPIVFICLKEGITYERPCPRAQLYIVSRPH